MMNLEENRSRIWFKVLSESGQAIDGSGEKWMLPLGPSKGDRLDFSTLQARYFNENNWVDIPGVTGSWLVSNPKDLYTCNSDRRIFVAELLSVPSHELPGIIWVHNVRLVREATNLDFKRFGIYRAFRQILDDED